MKKAMLVALSTVAAMSAFGQAKVETKSFDYNRSSVSVIALDGLTSYDNLNDQIAASQTFDGKFDMNKIQTKNLKVANDITAIQQALNDAGVVKQALNDIFKFDGKFMSNETLIDRAMYNATDADILQAKASKVNGIYAGSKGLLKNIYFIVAGPTSVDLAKDKKGNDAGYTAYVDAYVYKAAINEITLESINESFMDKDMSAAELKKAKTAYDALNIPVEFVAVANKCYGSGDNQQEAIANAYEDILQPLEKKIDAWNVVTTIFSKNPLGAKIGKKEGLKNSDRYEVFSVNEDATGALVYKHKGYVRATNIVDNAQVATGKSDCSNFYQIAGGILQNGWFLKQKKDLRIGVSASYNIGEDALSQFEVGFDYLLHTSQSFGMMQYALLNVGFDSEDAGSNSVQYIPVSLGLGLGVHPIRQLEVMPYAYVGGDYLMSIDGLTFDDEDDSFSKKIGYFGGAGVKASWQVWYPVQIFVKADYSLTFGDGGDYYKVVKECLDKERKGGFGLGIGAKYTF